MPGSRKIQRCMFLEGKPSFKFVTFIFYRIESICIKRGSNFFVWTQKLSVVENYWSDKDVKRAQSASKLEPENKILIHKYTAEDEYEKKIKWDGWMTINE